MAYAKDLTTTEMGSVEELFLTLHNLFPNLQAASLPQEGSALAPASGFKPGWREVGMAGSSPAPCALCIPEVRSLVLRNTDLRNTVLRNTGDESLWAVKLYVIGSTLHF